MNVLLSIKPEFAFKIFDGTKKFEFRKSIFKQKNIKKVFVYASSPIQQVIGEFEIENIIFDSTEKVWSLTKKHSGISKQFYDKYFENKEKAFAIEVGAKKKYVTPKLLSDFNLNYAPQSFAYVIT